MKGLLNRIQRNFLLFNKKKIFSFFSVYMLLILLSQFVPIAFYGEYQLLEVTQTIILICCLFLNFQHRKILVRKGNVLTLLIRQILILFLLYEELSFLTTNSNFLFNIQREFNLHNSFLVNSELLSFTIPVINWDLSITLPYLMYTSFLFILGYGSYFSFLNRIRYFFLEREYAIYTFLYIVNIVFSKILFELNFFEGGIYLLRTEILELFIYLLLLIDALKKRKIMGERRG